VIWNATRVSIIVLAVFAVGGEYIFSIFGVSELSLKVVGALVIAKVGFEMLSGKKPSTKPSTEERDEAVQKEMVGVVPLAIPMMAGPGAIITMMIFTTEAEDMVDASLVILSMVVTCLITMGFLLKADVLYKRIGDVGMLTIMRLLGVIIAAIGVQMMLDSITEFAEGNGL